jgi:hypothetical protein
MATTRNTQKATAFCVLAGPPVLLSVLALAILSTAKATSSTGGCVGSYGWPVAPFTEQHPVRANFGDPRTRFAGPQGGQALLVGGGTFSFHQGVDISAPDGSPVYAVNSGRIVRARGGRVTVACGNGRSFQYWHIEPVARAGQWAVAGKTLLGFVQPKREHVHLTHLERNRAVNPLAPGHISPYRDTTAPRVLAFSAERSASGQLGFMIEAADTPAISVPGRWHGFPVTPALVTWRVERAGRSVISGTAHDVRRLVPRNERFWSVFARGTHQNWPIFAGRKLQGVPGVYLFRIALTPRERRGLGAGTYTLTVVASDTAGNRGVRRVPFAVEDPLH